MIITGIESNDPYGSYICAGIVGLLTFQVFQNIGMTIGLLPITGIPLPFVSYGGTSSTHLYDLYWIGFKCSIEDKRVYVC